MAWRRELVMIRECCRGREFLLVWMEVAVMAVEKVLIPWKGYFDLGTALLRKAVAAGLRGPNLLDW
jgi:hypothetical protein